MDKLTQDEINFLVRLLQGERWYKVRGSSGNPGSIALDNAGNIIDHSYVVSGDALKSLASKGLIYLQPPTQELRHKYLGYWVINKTNFKVHPQYNEILTQVAVGVGPSK